MITSGYSQEYTWIVDENCSRPEITLENANFIHDFVMVTSEQDPDSNLCLIPSIKI